MKLTAVRIKDFRSLAGDHHLPVSTGLNYLVGANNVGKSNVLRAIELALDDAASYDPAVDRPARDNSNGGAPVKTRFSLSFQIGNTGPEQTLRRLAQAYEDKLRDGRRGTTFAEDGELHIVTEFGSSGARVTTFQAKGMGARSLPATTDEHLKLEKQFRSVVRFAVVHSGEDIESLLRGKFRDILNLVIAEHLRNEVQNADDARETYLNALQTELLEPLRLLVEERVGSVFTEISGVSLVPTVPTVSETLGSVEVLLVDALTSALTGKGTGVRGAVLVSMLQYLAAQSRRSLVLAVEEPEAFLHPAAQESIRVELERLASEREVSLLVTTHSPYVVARTASSMVTLVTKGADGATRIAEPVAGDSRLGPTLGSLYRDAQLSELVERGLAVPDNATAVVVTEGFTDWEFVKMGCEAAGRPELLENLHVIPAGGATHVVPQAVIASAATSIPVIVVLDADEHGRDAAKKLASFGWSTKKQIVCLDKWPGSCASGHDVEIEDLIPQDAALALAADVEFSIDKKIRCGSSKRYHYAFSSEWKTAAVGDVRDAAAPKSPRLPALLTDDPSGLVWLAEEIRRRAGALADSNARASGRNSARLDQ